MYEYLRQRALRGSREKYEAALAQVPDVEPEAYDRLEEAAALLDPAEEVALAEEGIAADLDSWPDYAADVECDDLDGQSVEEDSEVTARLDEIYGREDSRLDAALRRAQRQSLDPES